MTSSWWKYLLPAIVVVAWASTASQGPAQIIRELKTELKEKLLDDLKHKVLSDAVDKFFGKEEINLIIDFMSDCKSLKPQCVFTVLTTTTLTGPFENDDEVFRKEEEFQAACKHFVPIGLAKVKGEYKLLLALAERLDQQEQLLKDQEGRLIQRRASIERDITELRRKESLFMAASPLFSQEANRLVIEREKMETQTRQLQIEIARKLENTVFWKEHHSHWKNHFKQAAESLPNEAHRKAAMEYWRHYEATSLLPETPPPYFTGNPKDWKSYVESNRTAAKEYREIMEVWVQESNKISAPYYRTNNDYHERLSKWNSQKEALAKEEKAKNDSFVAVNKEIDALKPSLNTLGQDKMRWLKRLAAMRTVSDGVRSCVARCKKQSVAEALKWEEELGQISKQAEK